MHAAFARHIGEVRWGEQLHTRLIGIHVHRNSANGVDDRRDAFHAAFSVLEYKVVVKTARCVDVFNLCVDVAPDGFGLREIERRAEHGYDLACGNDLAVDAGEFVRVDLKHLPKHGAIILPCEVKVGMVGHVLNRVLIAVQHILNRKRVFLIQRVDDNGGECTGEALVPVRTGQSEEDSIAVDLRLPNLFIEANVAAVEAMVAHVRGELVLRAVERKACVFDAVCHAADGSAEEHKILLIILNRVVAEHDVYQFAIAVRNKHGLPGCAVVEKARGCALLVGDGIAKNGFAGWQMPEFRNNYAHADKPPVI